MSNDQRYGICTVESLREALKQFKPDDVVYVNIVGNLMISTKTEEKHDSPCGKFKDVPMFKRTHIIDMVNYEFWGSGDPKYEDPECFVQEIIGHRKNEEK